MQVINGQPGAIVLDGEAKIFAALMLEIIDGQIQVVRSVFNPTSLTHLCPVADA